MQQLGQSLRRFGDILGEADESFGTIEVGPLLQRLEEVSDGGVGVQIGSRASDSVDDVDVDVGQTIRERLEPKSVFRPMVR